MRQTESLKVRLLRNLMLFLALAWLFTIGVGYVLTQNTLNRQLDLQLEQVAESLSAVTTVSESSIAVRRLHRVTGNGNESIEFQIWQNDRMVTNSSHAPEERFSENEGYGQSDIDHKKWRVFSARSGASRVMVGQDLDVRNSLVQGMIWSNLWPMLIALPLIALILWLLVTAGLKPLSSLTSAINKRTPEQLTPIDIGDVPSEVAPVIQSLNALFGVVDKTLEREKQFADNAAHELRTPLAAIKTQAQLALLSVDPKEIQEGLRAVNVGVEQASKMITQLLTLARLDPEKSPPSFESVDLAKVAARAVANLAPLALAKKIEIGLDSTGATEVLGDLVSLDILVSNLVDNAIRYTPAGGVVSVQVLKSGDHVELRVEDSGPGIPEKDRERVFDRFVRLRGGDGEGSGIGLALVKKVADLHRAKIEMSFASGHSGLAVKIIFFSM